MFYPSTDLTLLTSEDFDKKNLENGITKGESVEHTNDVTSVKWSNDGN